MRDKPKFLRRLEPLDALKQRSVEDGFRDMCDVLQADDEWIPKLVALSGPETCVFLTSDNGFLFGQHRLTGKLVLYEESVRVPLAMWGCGAEKGRVDERLVSNVDLPATILELAGAVPTRPLDGRSLFGAPRPHVRLMGRWGENEVPGPNQGFSEGMRQPSWGFFKHSNGSMELYDVDHDPAQEINLARDSRYADRVDRLLQLMDSDRY